MLVAPKLKIRMYQLSIEIKLFDAIFASFKISRVRLTALGCRKTAVQESVFVPKVPIFFSCSFKFRKG